MSYSLCFCGSMLEGYPGSPCTNPGCINSRQNRARPVPARVEVAPLTGQVTRPAKNDRARARNRAARAARRRNRRGS